MMATDAQVYDTDDTYTDLYSGEIFHSYTDTVPSSLITFPSPGTKYGVKMTSDLRAAVTAVNRNLPVAFIPFTFPLFVALPGIPAQAAVGQTTVSWMPMRSATFRNRPRLCPTDIAKWWIGAS